MKKKLLRKRVIIPVAVVLVLAVVLALVGGQGAKAGKTAGLPMEKTKLRTIKETLDTSGTVASQQTKTYFSPVNAPVTSVSHGVGDSVRQGEKLVTFDTKNLERDNQKASLEVRSGQLSAQAAADKAGAAGTGGAAADQAGQLNAAAAATAQEIANLNAQIKAAQQNSASAAGSAYDQAVKAYNQQLGQVQAKVSQAQKTYDARKTAYDLAYSEWNTANANKDKESNIKALKDQVTQLSKQLGEAEGSLSQARSQQQAQENNRPVKADGKADVAGLESALKTKQEQLANLQQQAAGSAAAGGAEAVPSSAAETAQLDTQTSLAELTHKTAAELVAEGRKGIVSDFAGVVSDAQVVNGAMASQGAQLLTIASTAKVCVNISVSKYDFEKLQLNQQAEVELAGHTYRGTLTRINKIATKNEKGLPTIGAQVRIDDPDENIYLGVDAKVHLNCAEVNNAVSLSTLAVNEDKQGSFCYVIKDGKLKKQRVTKGVASNDYVQIKSGLRPGVKVVTDPGDHSEGDAVGKEGK